MRKYMYIFPILLILLCFNIGIKAQTSANFPELIPPSPNAQSFQKFGDFPVSNFTGIPNINIPIYTIELSDISLPISLSYNSSGIKVNEESGTVGLGWNLSVGGVISRTVYDQDDFSTAESLSPKWTYLNSNLQDYYLQEGQVQFPVIHACDFYITGSTGNLIPSLYGGQVHDLAPDVFNYSFNGYSGSFCITHNGTIYKESSDNIKILPEKIEFGTIPDWTLITPDGTQYKFTLKEYSRLKDGAVKRLSAWYLTEIKTLKNNIISFSYDITTKRIYSLSNLTQRYGSFNGASPALENVANQYNSPVVYDDIVLNKITFPNGEIYFKNKYERIDQPDNALLDQILIYKSGLNYLVKNIKLNYNYFRANRSDQEITSISEVIYVLGITPTLLQSYPFFKSISDNWNLYRLKLASVDIMDGTKKETYTLKYNENNLPTKLSTGRDHWGYYNGQLNKHLIPDQTYRNSNRPVNVIEGGMLYYPANREVNPSYNQAFILTEMIYPTGGKTKFEYESNKFLSSNSTGDNLQQNFYSQRKTIQYYGSRTSNPTVLYNSLIQQNFRVSESDYDCTMDIKILLPENAQTFINKIASSDKLLIELKNSSSGAIIETIELSKTKNQFILYPNTSDPVLLKTLIYKSTKPLSTGEYTLKIEGTLKSSFDEFDLKYSYVPGKYQFLSENRMQYAGGLRIKKITSYDSNGSTKVGEQSYSYDDNASYLITSYPRYSYMYLGKESNTTFYFHSNGLRSLKCPIGYGTVTVYQGDETGVNGKSVYNYNIKGDRHLDYSSHPRDYLTLPLNFALPFDHNFSNAPFLDISYKDNGQLLKESHYIKKGTSFNLVKEISNIYDKVQSIPLWGIMQREMNNAGDPNTPVDLNWFCTNMTSKYTPITAYLYPAIVPQWTALKKKTEKNYNENGVIQTTTTTDYEYDSSLKLLIKESTINSNGNMNYIAYTYMNELPLGAIKSKAQELNFLDGLVSVEMGTNNTSNKKINEYSLFNNVPLISVEKTNTGFGNTLESRLVYHNYDSYGNPLYISKDSSNKTFYLWSYQGQYPIAEIKTTGYTFAELEAIVNSVFSVPSINALSTLAVPNEAKLKDGSLQKVLSKALVTTYTFKPFFGMTSVTNPSGITTYYDYDNRGRLKRTYIKEKDSNGIDVEKNIQWYDYHYQNQ